VVNPGPLLGHLLGLAPLRPGADFFADESRSVICLDILLNQVVGVERATAVNYAIHDHVHRPFAGRTEGVAEVTGWPYEGVPLRRSARAVLGRLLRSDLDGAQRLGDLPSATIGGLASLERYYRRESRALDAIRSQQLTAEDLAPLADFAHLKAVAGDGLLGEHRMSLQLRSAKSVLERLADRPDGTGSLREWLLGLPQVGQETADTLLLCVFRQPVLIVDTYLARVLHRHLIVDSARPSALRALVTPWIRDSDAAHRLHARINEIGEARCRSERPDCAGCPLEPFPRRDGLG